jgi:alpha-L-fucosidase
VFNPTGFDADQIVTTLKQAGFEGMIVTAKHHDGFCLWPSKYTDHSVKNSPWKNGKGDVIRELADACRRHGLRLGIYLSPWDRHHADYGKPAYIEYFKNQLRELMTEYGPIFEFWMDNANGGDGYYGGARETRRIDRSTYYPWQEIYALIHQLQPQAVIWGESAPGSEVRWIGNEGGHAGDPCWVTVNPAQWINHGELNRGIRTGSLWMPGETNTSIRPGWFYHPSEDARVKSPARLMRLYFESVGRGTNLLLNVPPNRQGLIDPADVASLREWTALRQATFATDLARTARATSAQDRGGAPGFAASRVNDDHRETYWASDDTVLTPELVLTFPAPVTFNVVRLREHLPLGQRVDAFALDAWTDGKWQEFASAQAIGAQRVLSTRYITTERVRLRITQAAACPAISELGLFSMPALLGEPRIQRDRSGKLTLSTELAGPWIRYTLNGSEPTAASPLYQQPIEVPKGGTVRARSFLPKEGKQSLAVAETFGLAKGKWKVLSANAAKGGEAEKLIDENPGSIWNTWTQDKSQGAPQAVVLDLGERVSLRGFTLLPRQDALIKGTPDRYEVFVSDRPTEWGNPVAAGEFSNIRASKELQTIPFKAAASGRYVRLVFTHVLDDEPQVAVPEIGLLAD